MHKEAFSSPVLAVIVAGFLVCSCDIGGTTWEESAPPRGEGSPDVILSEETTLIKEKTLDKLLTQTNGDGNLPKKLEFRTGSKIDSIREGEFIVSGITKKTPRGLVREVSSKSKSGDRVVVETKKGNILDAYEKVDIDTTIEINSIQKKNSIDSKKIPNKRTNKAVRKSVASFCEGREIINNYCDEKLLTIDTGDLVKTKLGIALNIKRILDHDVEIVDGEIEEMDIDIYYEYESLAGIYTVSGPTISSRNTDGAKQLFEKVVAVIPVKPPEWVLTLEAEAEIGWKIGLRQKWSATSRVVAKNDNALQAGFDAQNGKLVNTSQLPSPESRTSYTLPTSLSDVFNQTTEARAEVFFSTNVETKLQNILGPTLEVQVPVFRNRFFSDPNGTEKWAVDVGTRTNLGVVVDDPFGLPGLEVSVTENAYRRFFTLEEAQFGESSESEISKYLGRVTEGPRSEAGIASKRKITWQPPRGDDEQVRYYVYAFNGHFDADDVRGCPPGPESNSDVEVVGSTNNTEFTHLIQRSDKIDGEEVFGEDIYYRVTAVAGGCPDPFNETFGSRGIATPPKNPIPEVKRLSASSRDSAVTLNWREDEGSDLLDGYVLYRDTEPFEVDRIGENCDSNDGAFDGDDACGGVNIQDDLRRRKKPRVKWDKVEESEIVDKMIQNPPYVDENLDNGTTYYYRILPIVDTGHGISSARPLYNRLEGDQSDMVSVTPLSEPPDQPSKN